MLNYTMQSSDGNLMDAMDPLFYINDQIPNFFARQSLLIKQNWIKLIHFSLYSAKYDR